MSTIKINKTINLFFDNSDSKKENFDTNLSDNKKNNFSEKRKKLINNLTEEEKTVLIHGENFEKEKNNLENFTI